MFLQFEGIENVRDLGGMTRADGAVVRTGRLLRTGRLEKATDADAARLEKMGLWAVVDFRDIGECDRNPDRVIGSAVYHKMPALPPLSDFFGKPGEPGFTAKRCHDDFCMIYRLLAQSPQSQETYTKFFEILLASQGRTVLWHCTQGKDRTGVAAMLLLSALGFEREQILDEFMLTNEFTLPLLERMLSTGHHDDADIMREVFTVWRENAQLYFDTVELEYGSVQNYLEMALNIGPEQIETLEGYYLE